MRRILLIGLVNMAVFVLLLGAVELYFRVTNGTAVSNNSPGWTNGLYLQYAPYVGFTNVSGPQSSWKNEFTNERYETKIVANSLGFNDKHEFSLTEPYQKAANERVILFTGGSVAWGLGSSSTDTTIAGRLQSLLNEQQSKIKYTVINLAMGGWIAYQQFTGLELWGTSFDPDWIVSMDGFNDAGVGCAYSQGVGNPMYYQTMKAYIDGYLMSTIHPAYYRGWMENQLIKWSAAYRALTGKTYVPYLLTFDDSSKEDNAMRRAIVPTKVGDARQMLDFYLKSEMGMLRLFPNARYILSTQPIVNQIEADFTHVYDSPLGSEAQKADAAKREADVEAYLKQNEDKYCSQATQHPAYVYILVNGAIRLARLVEDQVKLGRSVEYANTGLLFPKERPDRIPYFIDSAHLNDKGADLIARFYAQRILERDSQ